MGSWRTPTDVQLTDLVEEFPEFGGELLESERDAVLANSYQVRAGYRAVADVEGRRLDAMFVPMEKGNAVSHVELGIVDKCLCRMLSVLQANGYLPGNYRCLTYLGKVR